MKGDTCIIPSNDTPCTEPANKPEVQRVPSIPVKVQTSPDMDRSDTAGTGQLSPTISGLLASVMSSPDSEAQDGAGQGPLSDQFQEAAEILSQVMHHQVLSLDLDIFVITNVSCSVRASGQPDGRHGLLSGVSRG